MKGLLKPLTIANNVVQACLTRLDHVGLTLANLYWIYNSSAIKAPIWDQVLGSLETQWQAGDQDVFILAMDLHPWIQGCCFEKSLSRSVLYNMAKNVYKKVFKQEPGWGLLQEFIGYSEGVGIYSDESMWLAYWKQKQEESVCSD